MDANTADRIYDVLVQHAGAQESGRKAFIQVQTTEDCREYRFQGSLGFGGKFWQFMGLSRYEWRVTMYPEDLTPARASALADCNDRLKQLCKVLT